MHNKVLWFCLFMVCGVAIHLHAQKHAPTSNYAQPPPPPLGDIIDCTADDIPYDLCPCQPAMVCAPVPVPANLPVQLCKNALYDREVLVGPLVPTGAYHTFWYTYMSIGGSYGLFINTLDGGPDSGYLNAWRVLGSQGHEAGDNINYSNVNLVLADYFGLYPQQCRASYDMNTYTDDWLDFHTVYNAVLGYNSNSFAHFAGNAAALPLVKPTDWVPGW